MCHHITYTQSVGEQHTVSSKNRALPILELPSFFKDIVLSYDDSLPANKVSDVYVYVEVLLYSVL